MVDMPVDMPIRKTLLCAIIAWPLAAQDSCKLVMDATTRVFDTPTHAYVTMKMNGTNHDAESINTGGMVYIKSNGTWSPGTSSKEMKDLADKSRQNTKMTCRYLKDEPVDGQIAAVYTVHEVSPKSTSDSKTWISKAKGTLLRSDIDMDGGKTHVSTRYEYGNVKPPK
jgi:hypothetical protein